MKGSSWFPWISSHGNGGSVTKIDVWKEEVLSENMLSSQDTRDTMAS